MITISDAEYVLKDYYLDVITSQLNAEISPFYNAIAKSCENVYGKQVKMSIIKNGMASVKACEEDEDLPSPNTNRYLNIEEPLKNIYGTIELSDKLIRASSESSNTLINMLNAEMEGLISGAKANLARMLYGNEDGFLTKVVRKISSYVLQVEDVKTSYIYRTVNIGTSSNRIEATITKVDRTNNTITISKNIDSYSFDGGETILLSGASGNELKGLSYIFDGNSCYGYNKTSEPFFMPKVLNVSSDELCEDNLIEVIDEIEENSGSKVNMILCSFKTRRLLAKLYANSKQIVNTSDIQGGCTNIFVNTVPVYADAFCPDGRIYFLNTNDFVLCQLCDWSWLENESGRVLTQVPGKAAFSATLVKYAELICKRPCGQGLIKITD